MPRSKFDVVQESLDMIWIIDRDEGHLSVTNDAESVVAHLVRMHGDKRIIYKDTMGNWDELVHQSGVFMNFRPAPEFRFIS